MNIKDKEGKELNQVDQFKYLGVTFSEEGGSETAVRARVKAGWQKWRELGPLIADKKIPTKLKTKLYTTVVRPGSYLGKIAEICLQDNFCKVIGEYSLLGMSLL